MEEYEFSCSTMWNIRSHENSMDALREMVDMGFTHVELNYLVTQEAFTQMLPFILQGSIKVSSVHNVFPKSYDEDYGTDSALLGHIDKDKRKEALRLTKISIDHAQRIGAAGVVLHVSVLQMSKDYNQILKNLYLQGKRNGNEYEGVLKTFLAERDSLSKQVLDITAESLLELSDYMEQKQYTVKLGIENRAQVNQIPTFDEMDYFLEKLKGTNSRFWYDIGHGILMENMGVFSVFPHILKLQDSIMGMHIHDAQGVDDHYYPYKFGVAFDRYLPLIKKAPIKVLEVGPKNSQQEVQTSLKMLKKKLTFM